MMPGQPRNEPQRPPASEDPARPATPPASPPALAALRASVASQRVRASDLARRAAAWALRHPPVMAGAFAALLAVAGAATAAAIGALPGVELGPRPLEEAREEARAHPTDAIAQRELGHALWATRNRRGAVAAYRRAVTLDRDVADEQVVANLLASFGTPEQREAEAAISKARLVAAEPGLQRLVRSGERPVRWGAVRALDRLGKGSKAYWETAYLLDLASPDCEVRRAAVEKLGEIGTARAVAALRDSRADDEKTGGFLRPRCLGGRLDEAEQRILARR